MNNRQIAKMTLRIDFMISTVQTASLEFEKEKLKHSNRCRGKVSVKIDGGFRRNTGAIIGRTGTTPCHFREDCWQ